MKKAVLFLVAAILVAAQVYGQSGAVAGPNGNHPGIQEGTDEDGNQHIDFDADESFDGSENANVSDGSEGDGGEGGEGGEGSEGSEGGGEAGGEGSDGSEGNDSPPSVF